jgi:transcriptional regulator with XRE-family HTH domain
MLVRLTPGQSVRITREFAELSQSELAKRAGLAQGTLSAIEAGKVALGVERAKRLARALKVHPAALLFADYDWR